MKKLYYFSKSKLQFIEVKNLKAKMALFLSLFLTIGLAAIFVVYFIITSLFGSASGYSSVKEENKELRSKLGEVVEHYSRLEKSLDSLVKANDDLRVSANLPPVSEDERAVGVGGGYFNNDIDFLEDGTYSDINKALSYVDEISRKIDFEKKQYLSIEKSLKRNQKLFESIPAIVPCSGTIANHGFGLRLHPILRVTRMHEGIDIITDVGTKVYCSGKGTVEFVGYRGGFGLAVEVDHGFGYKTIYAHLSNSSVKVGQKLNRGDYIALTGNTGLSSGPHLHYEVLHDGVKKDPTEFFFDDMGFFDLNKKNIPQ